VLCRLDETSKFSQSHHENVCCRSVVARSSLIYCLLHALPTNFCWVIADVCCVGWLSITMPSYSKESSLLTYANAKHFLLLKKESCSKADIKTLILKCRNSSSAYSTVLRELQDLSKDRFHKPVNVCPIPVVLKLFGSWATFSFRNPSRATRINNLNKNSLKRFKC